MTKLANINDKDLMSIFKCAPDGATHYVDFNPGCYENKTYAVLIGNDICLCRTRKEMAGVVYKDLNPNAYSLVEIGEELEARVLAKVDTL